MTAPTWTRRGLLGSTAAPGGSLALPGAAVDAAGACCG
jgi:hypothetical protein